MNKQLQMRVEQARREAKMARLAEIDARDLAQQINVELAALRDKYNALSGSRFPGGVYGMRKEADVRGTREHLQPLTEISVPGDGARFLSGYQGPGLGVHPPSFVSCPVQASRLPQADALWDDLDSQGKGKVDVEAFADVVNRWEPDFSVEAVVSTFRTCGAKGGQMDKTSYYSWVDKVWSGLSDERFDGAIQALQYELASYGMAGRDAPVE